RFAMRSAILKWSGNSSRRRMRPARCGGDSMNKLLADVAERATRYVSTIGGRRVFPLAEDIARLDALGGPLHDDPCEATEVLAMLDDFGSPGTVASTGGRYFGFVTGGALP